MAVVGRIARPHGIRGQVVVNPETDFPEERFRSGAELFTRRADGQGEMAALVISTARFQQERPVIGFAGMDDINAVQTLVGRELRVPVERLAALPPDTYYRHSLIDCHVETVDGTKVGIVTGVEGTMTGSRLVVTSERGEILVPLVAPICLTIDPEAKRIVIAPPEGLLDVNLRGA